MPRMVNNLILASAAAACLAACATTKPPAQRAELITPRPSGWRGIASEADKGRVARLGDAWQQGLTESRGKGFRRAVSGEGALLDQGAALLRPALPPGSYRCRLVRLGTAKGRGTAFTAFKPFFCYVGAENEALTFTKQTGTDRPAGRIYAENEKQDMFLGTLVTGNEKTPLAYGERADRDMVGVVERIGPFKWRMLFPWPQTDAKMDILELIPVIE